MSFKWVVIERDLGLPLPADYKLLAGYLPPGWFRTFVRMDRPEISDGWPRGHYFLDEFAEGEMAPLREWRTELKVPYPIYPEPGGLLRWGSIRQGGHAFWLTDPAEEPENWPVVIASDGYEAWGGYVLIGGVSFSSALRRYIADEADPLPPRDPAGTPVTFEPARR